MAVNNNNIEELRQQIEQLQLKNSEFIEEKIEEYKVKEKKLREEIISLQIERIKFLLENKLDNNSLESLRNILKNTVIYMSMPISHDHLIDYNIKNQEAIKSAITHLWQGIFEDHRARRTIDQDFVLYLKKIIRESPFNIAPTIANKLVNSIAGVSV